MSKSPSMSRPLGNPHGGDGYCASSDVSLFSSSLPTLSHEKLNFTDSDSCASVDDSSPTLNKLVVGNTAKDLLEDAGPNSSEILLPENEYELLGGIMDELNFSRLPNEAEDLEECDVFCMGGGMELDVEPRDSRGVSVSEMQTSDGGSANASVPCMLSKTSGRVSVEHPNGEHPSRTLFVRNINSSVEDSELRTLFEPYGEIRSLYTACKSRGFVMISFYDIRSAHNAMRALQNKVLRKRTLDIHFSIPKDNPSEKDINQGTLVIFNLDASVSNDELRQIFSTHGEIKEVTRDILFRRHFVFPCICVAYAIDADQIRETPHRRFHRFIEYYDVRHAEAALKALNRSEIGGKRIKLEVSRPGGARRPLFPLASPELERSEPQSYFNQASLQFAGSPPGNWPNLGSPVKGKSLHGFHWSPGTGIFRPINTDNVPGLASILPSRVTGFPKFSPIGSDQGMLNLANLKSLSKDLMPDSAYGRPHSLPEHVAGRVSSSSQFIESQYSGLRTLSDHPYQFGSPPLYSNYTSIGSTSSAQGQSSGRHGFLYPGKQGSLLGKYEHHAGSAPSSIYLDGQISYFPESPGTSSTTSSRFGSTGAGRNYIMTTNAHAQASSGVHHPGNRHKGGSPAFGMVSMPKAFSPGNPGLGSSVTQRFVEYGRAQHTETHGNNQVVDDSRLQIDVDKISSGDDIRTTLMIKNIPNKYTYKMLMAEIDEKHKGTYDFLYLPIDLKNKCNMGHAFINMVSPLHIVPFLQTFKGKRWEKFNSGKVASLAFAEIQGRATLNLCSQHSCLVNEEKQFWPSLFQSEGQDSSDQQHFLSSGLDAFPAWSHPMDHLERPNENPLQIKNDLE